MEKTPDFTRSVFHYGSMYCTSMCIKLKSVMGNKIKWESEVSKSCLFRVDGDVKSLKSPVFCFRCFTKKPDGHFVSCALTASVNVDEKKD